VALVTRNTNQSVDAFFGLVGDEWRGLFSEIRTREFKYCKPDKRLLLELAEVSRGVRCGVRFEGQGAPPPLYPCVVHCRRGASTRASC
jgi:hypothetical protein